MTESRLTGVCRKGIKDDLLTPDVSAAAVEVAVCTAESVKVVRAIVLFDQAVAYTPAAAVSVTVVVTNTVDVVCEVVLEVVNVSDDFAVVLAVASFVVDAEAEDKEADVDVRVV